MLSLCSPMLDTKCPHEMNKAKPPGHHDSGVSPYQNWDFHYETKIGTVKQFSSAPARSSIYGPYPAVK